MTNVPPDESSAPAGSDPAAAPPLPHVSPAAPTTRTLARNILWIWVASAADMGVGFLLAPFLVDRLGNIGYGIWLLITSLSSYLLLLDLGVRSSVGRYIALHHARGDQHRVNTTASTALAIWCGMALLVVLAIATAQVLFFDAFAVPEPWVGQARLALWFIGFQLALKLPLDVFAAVLYGFQRFDLTNVVQVAHAFARGILTVVVVGAGLGLPGLAFVLLLLQVLAGTACLVLVHRVNPALRLRPTLVRRDDARDLFGFGAWNTVMAVGRLITPALSPALVGALLGIAFVTPFSLTTRLIAMSVAILSASAAVLTPLTAHFHARAQADRQQALFVAAGKYCWPVALYLCALLILLGGPFLSLWIGPELASASTLLTVLAVGELLPFSQHASSSVILGLARHRRLALLTLGEVLGVVALAVALVPAFGLLGMGFAIALPGMVCRGLVPMLYGCRLLNIPVHRYLAQALLPAIAPALVAGVALASATQWQTPTSWLQLVTYVAAYTGCFAASCLLAPGWSELRTLVRARALHVCGLIRRSGRTPLLPAVPPLGAVVGTSGPKLAAAPVATVPLAQE